MRVVVAVLFIVSLYFVETGFCGSSVVAGYKGGFGTVDMKEYDVNIVHNAISPMNEKGSLGIADIHRIILESNIIFKKVIK